ncbi:21284_t:CDS:2, partial [Gigaspora margarita]
MSLVYTKEALAELWDVEDSGLLHYLSIENNLVAVDRALRKVLRGFRSSFGGTYLDVKNNTAYCNTVDETKGSEDSGIDLGSMEFSETIE